MKGITCIFFLAKKHTVLTQTVGVDFVLTQAKLQRDSFGAQKIRVKAH